MNIYACRAYFSMEAAGWQEMFWGMFNTAHEAMLAWQDLLSARSFMLGSAAQVKCDRQVVERAPEDNVRDEDEDDILIRNDTGVYKASDVDYPGTGQDVIIRSINSHRRVFTMRGVPDSIMVQPWDTSPATGAWTDAYNVWAGKVHPEDGGPWRIRYVDSAKPLIGITAIDTINTGGLLVTAPGHGLVTGDQIQLVRVPCSDCRVQGIQVVVYFSPTQFRLPHYNVGRVGYKGGGTFRKIAWLYDNIRSLELGAAGSRQAGRPHEVKRGRRSCCR